MDNCSNENGNHIYIFDLKQLLRKDKQDCTVQEYEFSYDPENSDIIIPHGSISGGLSVKAPKGLVDSSLASYIRYLYLNPNNRIRVYVNMQEIKFQSYLKGL